MIPVQCFDWCMIDSKKSDQGVFNKRSALASRSSASTKEA
jgi:hypothetical protein